MALIPCAGCGNKISDKAIACPKCGRTKDAEELLVTNIPKEEKKVDLENKAKLESIEKVAEIDSGWAEKSEWEKESVNEISEENPSEINEGASQIEEGGSKVFGGLILFVLLIVPLSVILIFSGSDKPSDDYNFRDSCDPRMPRKSSPWC